MQNAEQAQNKSMTNRFHELQQTLDAKGYWSLGMGIAGIVVGLTFCPLSILAVACPYWTASTDAASSSSSISSSLWTVSVTVNVGGSSIDSSMDMCGDEMHDSGECGKIDALRFFTIATTLLLCASAALIIIGFSPVLNSNKVLRIRVAMTGVVLAILASLFVFLGICIAASVDIPTASLNGAGFVSLVLELFAIIPAIALSFFALRREQSTSVAGGVAQPAAKNAQCGPNLLGVNGATQKTQVAGPQDVKGEDVESGLSGTCNNASPTTQAVDPKSSTTI